MHDLRKALDEIGEIRSRLALGTVFRGYGPATFAGTGLLAIAAALAQARWIADPASRSDAYLALWMGTAAVCALAIAIEVVTRSRRIHRGLADRMIRAAAEQLLPALAAGALVTFVLHRHAPESLWMLPGLWQIILSLGIFASCRMLPRPFFAIGVWYLLTGLSCLALAGGAHAFSPWAMGAPFGLGQLLAAFLILGTGGGDGRD